MKITLDTKKSPLSLNVISAFSSKGKIQNSHWQKPWKEAFKANIGSISFDGSCDTFLFSLKDGTAMIALGLGEKLKCNSETIRRASSNFYKYASAHYKSAVFITNTFKIKSLEQTISAIVEGIIMSSYKFDKYKHNPSKPILEDVNILVSSKSIKLKKALADAIIVSNAINFSRSLCDEPPNILNSETYAKLVEKDVKAIKGVTTKIFGKEEIKRQKMGMFLSVNDGSKYGARLVHLKYTPARIYKNTKHIALVGKGVTFDSGGYSIKPASSIINMKYDMSGSAVVYAAFKAAAQLKLNIKVSCFLGLTDNAISSNATMPDSIVTARNGKSVEIQNTDAEGRLVLGDIISYACDQKVDAIIDAATLTGAVIAALGIEVCGVMGNNQKLIDNILKASKEVDEYMWQLPLIKEFSDDMKSSIADLSNIGKTRYAGSQKGGAFLKEFVKEGIPWAHLDIAGVADGQKHLPYCPTKGSSGLIIRTLVKFLSNAKI